MSDPIACLKLTLTPNIFFSPMANLETVSRCLDNVPQKAAAKILPEAISFAGGMVAGRAAGKLARNAVRFGTKAGTSGAAKGSEPSSGSKDLGEKSSCISPLTLSLGALFSPFSGIRGLLISPMGTPDSIPRVCTPDQDPYIQSMIRGSEVLSDVGAEILWDVLGPGPALWMADHLGL